MCIVCSLFLSILSNLSISLSLYISLSVYLSICPPVYLSICLSVYLSIYLSNVLSTYFIQYTMQSIQKTLVQCIFKHIFLPLHFQYNLSEVEAVQKLLPEYNARYGGPVAAGSPPSDDAAAVMQHRSIAFLTGIEWALLLDGFWESEVWLEDHPRKL